ncbi:MAG: hypothetical protein K8F56_12810 [Rhodocyclaceae bacterium]|nr:hypothetical protein [Rhodocyclaceae bacterium]
MKQAKKSVPAGRRPHPRATRHEQGAALLLFMILVVMAALAYLISNLTPEAIERRRNLQSQEALTLAREALIGYALRYRDDQVAKDLNSDGDDDRVMYGYLPLPDLGSGRNNNIDPKCHLVPGDLSSPELEGCDANTFTGIAFDVNGIGPSVVGRLPWRTLGIEPLRDGHGECLWMIVSSLHSRIQRSVPSPVLPPMNWDTLGQLDIVVANGSASLASILATPHDRPVAVIFSPGPPLPGQNRADLGGNDVTQCGGNYDAKNYLDPNLATALGNVTNYLTGANSASGTTGDSDPSNDPDPPAPDTPKKLSIQGKIFASASNFLPNACPGGDCTLVSNDAGLMLTSDQLFAATRKHAYFRTDINSMLDRITDCLRDQGTSGYGKISGANDNSCYGTDLPPRGYYPNYREMLLVAGGGTMTVNGNNCAGAVLFGNQRNTKWEPAGEPSGNTPKCPKTNATNPYQCRVSADDKTNAAYYPGNYLEEINLTSFSSTGTIFSGQETFERVSSTQTPFQDIVRCIPTTASFVTTLSSNPSPTMPQLAAYSTASRTITLGQVVSTAPSSSLANSLFACAWRPESRTMDGGLRSYFTFRINENPLNLTFAPHEGFAFAIVDGDNNGTDACGAAAQHLGYSGNNLETPFIVQPKIAFEIDPRREGTVFPSTTNSNHLTNGRTDPSHSLGFYRGGHVAITYWGGETAIDTTISIPPPPGDCIPPAFASGTTCWLPPEEDDNVHARPISGRAGFPIPPANPVAPTTPPVAPTTPLAVPPYYPLGVYKLDPQTEQVPTNRDFHVRVELTRTTPLNIRVATTSNLNISAPGNPINSVTLTDGDRVWVRQQSDPSENGMYIWNGAATPMTRVSDPAAEPDSNYSQPRVRVATTASTNLNLNDPGIDTIDNVYLFAGDRILVKNQAVPAQNGIYVWNAPHQPLTRASDADSAAELAGMVVEVMQGAQNARSIWRQNTTNLTVGTNALNWTNFRVKIATSAAINLSSPGSEIDGIKIKNGDRVLVKNNGGDNGVYRWNGASAAMTLEPDIFAGSSIVQVQQGSEATALWLVNGAATQRLSTVRVASQSSLSLTAPGGKIDGVVMNLGERVLVKNQASAIENGIYQWNGAASTMTRTADASTEAALAGTLSQVIEGSDAGRIFRQTTLTADGTLGTDAVLWAAIDRSTSYLLEIWILPEGSGSNMINAMKDTTRSMSLLYPGFLPYLRDRPVIPYPFRNVRLGFTTGQRTSINDQTISISNSFTTWLP